MTMTWHPAIENYCGPRGVGLLQINGSLGEKTRCRSGCHTKVDRPQSGGHGSPQSGGHSGPRTGGYQTKQDKKKAMRARQKAKRRAAQASSAAMEHSSPPASPPASLTSSPCRLDGQEAKQPSGGRRPNTAKHRTTQEAGGVPGAPLPPAARSSSPTPAAAAAAPTPT